MRESSQGCFAGGLEKRLGYLPVLEQSTHSRSRSTEWDGEQGEETDALPESQLSRVQVSNVFLRLSPMRDLIEEAVSASGRIKSDKNKCRSLEIRWLLNMIRLVNDDNKPKEISLKVFREHARGEKAGLHEVMSLLREKLRGENSEKKNKELRSKCPTHLHST